MNRLFLSLPLPRRFFKAARFYAWLPAALSGQENLWRKVGGKGSFREISAITPLDRGGAGGPGPDGVTAMDSVGPVLRIDIRSGRPLMGSEMGYGWLTGSAIKPIILRYVDEIAGQTSKPVIGIGGVVTAADVVEMMMAGAGAVGLCTARILKGMAYLSRLNREIEVTSEVLDSPQSVIYDEAENRLHVHKALMALTMG